MPASKFAHTRYQVINACFTNRVKNTWSAEELLDRLQEHDIFISKRTLETDIESMRFDDRLGYNAPIFYDKKNRGYRYDKENYSINQLQLTNEDIQTLRLARDFIRPYLELNLLRNFEPIIEKIIRCAHHVPQVPENNIPAILTESKFGCDPNDVNTLIQMICDKVVVKITVITLATQEHESLFFHPYWLHQVDNTWFFGGLIDEPFTRKIAFFQLRQLVNIASTEREFIRH